MSTPKPAATFTARETELLTIAFQCLKSKPDIDYNLMALKANLKGAKSARDSFNPLYNKIIAGKFGDTAAATSSPAKDSPANRSLAKGSPLKRKGVVESGGADGDDDDDDEDEIASPLKKAKATPRKTKAKGKGKKEEKVEEDGDGVEADGDNIVVKAEVLDGGDGGADAYD
ncbi:hypothetical protein Q7P36_008542 [Cladosporium allicinum]